MASDHYIVSAWQDSKDTFRVETKCKDGRNGSCTFGGHGELKGFSADSYTYQKGNNVVTCDADGHQISSHYTSY